MRKEITRQVTSGHLRFGSFRPISQKNKGAEGDTSPQECSPQVTGPLIIASVKDSDRGH
jgi:hypothetical protein